MRRFAVLLSMLLVSTTLTGCSVSYYWQALSGHTAVMRQRQPVAEVLADPATPPAVRSKLELIDDALAFATTRLDLPDNGSYRQYADIGRQYVVWNVFAAPEFSLQPKTWCYPVAGCVSYRGYFSEAAAHKFADRLRADSYDVFVGGVAAYSTLGKQRDPVLNTMLDQPDYRLAGLLFHELAHQRLYLADDTAFSESFASAVEQAGVHAWLDEQGDVATGCRYQLLLLRRQQVRALLAGARQSLEQVYARPEPENVRRAGKAAVLADLRLEYGRLRASWDNAPDFDGWFGDGLNNAGLAALAAYDQHVPAFLALLQQSGQDFSEFYARAQTLAELPPAARTAALEALAAAASPGGFSGCESPGSPAD